MISDTVDRLPLYEALIPEAGKIARAFQSKVPSDVSCEVREKSYSLKKLSDDEIAALEAPYVAHTKQHAF